MTNKTITQEEYYMAKALFTLAREQYQEGQKFEGLLARYLKSKDDNYLGHLSDAMFDLTISFEEGMKREGYVVGEEEEKDLG